MAAPPAPQNRSSSRGLDIEHPFAYGRLVVALDWVWHAGVPMYATHADGPTRAVAVHVARPGGVKLQGNIPTGGGPFVELPPVDTLAELEVQVVAWYVEHPPAPLPEPVPPRGGTRRVGNRPEPARWPRGAR